MKLSTTKTLPELSVLLLAVGVLLTLGVAGAQAQPIGEGRIVQTGCDTLSLVPDSIRVRITFGVINLGDIPICSIHLTAIQSGSIPADSCRILKASPPSGWLASTLVGTGDTWWDAVPPGTCIEVGGMLEPFTIEINPFFCCYNVEYEDENGVVFFTETVCFECEMPVQVNERSWGLIKSQYR